MYSKLEGNFYEQNSRVNISDRENQREKMDRKTEIIGKNFLKEVELEIGSAELVA